ncbi:replication initiator protein A [Streptococcus oralis]|uniref:replication initiator protein A n=1 Tax=Streptococcus oralis TaxID=1303 RepID=UPI000A100117|nr:replication initiator protein A [Streptococcus oralis]MCY7073073.1 replication initiator protein A [Streptococcus oralis]ORO72443.1 replication initiator protein [Streptococcus oralis subsp. oralis]
MERISLAQVNNGERFFRVPKLLFESELYKKMSAESKLLYAILKDRFELSVKNNWIDADGNIYFIFTVEEIGEMLGCGKDKVIKLKKELKKYDLLEEVRQGLNKPNLIYLGSLKVENEAKPLMPAEVGKSEFRKSENQNSRTLENRSQDFGISEPNDTDSSEPEFSDTDFSLEEEEEKAPQNPEGKNKGNLSRKVDKATKYDRDYIWNLVHDQLLKENFSQATADYAMIHFNDRYEYALENMRFARSSEMVAEYVFNGIVSEWNRNIRKQQAEGMS